MTVLVTLRVQISREQLLSILIFLHYTRESIDRLKSHVIKHKKESLGEL